MSISRKLERTKDLLSEAEQKLPSGELISGRRGTYEFMHLLGWVSKLGSTGNYVVKVMGCLLHGDDMVGYLTMDLPVFPDTLAAVAYHLQKAGWSGQTWSDGSWPEDPDLNEDFQAALKNHLEMVDNLKSSLYFKVAGEKPPTIIVTVSKNKGPFLMDPLEDVPETANPDLVTALKALTEDPSQFINPKKKKRFLI